MILPHSVKKEQVKQRLELKHAESALARTIVCGTNCSPFESAIIVDKAKEAFGIGQYAEDRLLDDGQMIFFAVSAEAPPGMPIEQCDKLRVALTHLRRKDDLEVLRRYGHAAKRRQQIMRMAVEAKEQGALLTQEDLALILDCDVRTIRSDIKQLKDQGVVVPTRGTVRDIGPGVTHKRKAVQLWLSGAEPLQVAKQLHHSLRAVERYINTFCRVVYTQKKVRDNFKTALIVGVSLAAVNDYWQLHDQLIRTDEVYQQRLEEILRIGEAHWQAHDLKKSRSLTTRRKPGGSKA